MESTKVGFTTLLRNTNRTDISCTIRSITDDFYHNLEFYIHNDAPLSCRVPSRPLGGESVVGPVKGATSMEVGGEDYTSLVFALTGTLQVSHIHVSTDLNVLVHSSVAREPKSILAAAAYSISPLEDARKVIIGEPLPLKMSVRWVQGTRLPSTSLSIEGGNSFFWNMFLFALVASVCYGGFFLYKKRQAESFRSYPGSGPYGYGFPHGYGLPTTQGSGFNFHGGPGAAVGAGMDRTELSSNGGSTIGKRD
jgi:hypothetical protein